MTEENPEDPLAVKLLRAERNFLCVEIERLRAIIRAADNEGEHNNGPVQEECARMRDE